MDPPHGASDRVRLANLQAPLAERGIELRAWHAPRLAAGSGIGAADPAPLLWADVVWVRRFADTEAVADDGTIGASGAEELLAAALADPDVLARRPVLYDIDVDLFGPRTGTFAAAVQAVAGQPDRWLRLARTATCATAPTASSVQDRYPGLDVRVTPGVVPAAAYGGAVREPGRVPVVAWIDPLDGPGGIGDWLAAITASRPDLPPFRLVRLCDPVAPPVHGFDEVVAADEGSDAWVEQLVAMAPDVVLAPSSGDSFASSLSPVAWLEATAVGAATIARAVTPYADLDDAAARRVESPDEVPAALAALLASPADRASLVDRARRLADSLTADAIERWAGAFRDAADAGGGAGLARRARRAAIGAAAGRIGRGRPATRAGLGLAGVIPCPPALLAAALDAACRMTPPPVEISLAGDPALVREAGTVCAEAAAAGIAIRLVAVDEGTPPSGVLAAAVAATRAPWIAVLDPAVEALEDGLGTLAGVCAENGLVAGYGEVVVPRADGTVDCVGAWPPSSATVAGGSLVVRGDVARDVLPPPPGGFDDQVLDWVLAIQEAGGAIGSIGVRVARALPPDLRPIRIRNVGMGVPYADGGEDRLLGIVGGASDRSSTSDELAAGITDWTTRYHLSRLRGNIVRSVALPPGSRVIDVGAGTGTVARVLGEEGLQVVALEGSLDRAQVAAVRCADLPNVEVVHATIGDYEEPGAFDAVVVIGVLEYSGSFQGGAAGPDAFLGRVRRLLRDDGVLVLAIENRFGLKYLQGYAEDHLGRPWVGIDGYGGPPGVRTWSRRALGELLAKAGLAHQRWRYPFPDYKLPSVVVDERAYRQPDAATLVDALVRAPVKDLSNPRTLVRDDRSAHAGLLEAGLGEDVANSFLVIASADAAALDRAAPPTGPLAWMYGDERASRWLRRRTLVDDGEGRRVDLDSAAGVVEVPGLRQVRDDRDPFVQGPTLEQELKVALGAADLDAVAALLREWQGAIDAEAAASADAARDEDATPFAPAPGEAALPGRLLDLIPANFIRRPDGTLARVDREWQLTGALSRPLAMVRALWTQAHVITDGAWATPWPPGSGLEPVAVALATMAGLTIDDDLIARFRQAESWLWDRVQLDR